MRGKKAKALRRIAEAIVAERRPRVPALIVAVTQRSVYRRLKRRYR